MKLNEGQRAQTMTQKQARMSNFDGNKHLQHHKSKLDLLSQNFLFRPSSTHSIDFSIFTSLNDHQSSQNILNTSQIAPPPNIPGADSVPGSEWSGVPGRKHCQTHHLSPVPSSFRQPHTISPVSAPIEIPGRLTEAEEEAAPAVVSLRCAIRSGGVGPST